MNEVCIVAARRTPFGRFLGSLSRLSAVDLAGHAAEIALADIDRAKIDQVIVGNILGAGLGMNIARQVGVNCGLPISTPAFTVNMMCASGMQAIALAAQAIRAGDAKAVLCGGTESMSNAPHLLARSRTGIKLGDGKLVDSLLRDGLVDAFDHRHMAFTAEALAAKFTRSAARPRMNSRPNRNGALPPRKPKEPLLTSWCLTTNSRATNIQGRTRHRIHWLSCAPPLTRKER